MRRRRWPSPKPIGNQRKETTTTKASNKWKGDEHEHQYKWELEKGIKHHQQIIKMKHKRISPTNENQKKETNVITTKRSKHFYQVTLPRVDAQLNGSLLW